jgi:hypothetical protein
MAAKEKINERKAIFTKETARKLLSGIRSINPLDDDTTWLFQEVFEDIGYRRIDKNHEMEKALYELSREIHKFKKIAIQYWKTYNRYSQKGL